MPKRSFTNPLVHTERSQVAIILGTVLLLAACGSPPDGAGPLFGADGSPVGADDGSPLPDALACEAGYADCNAAEYDGCEASTELDAEHCGGCDMACAVTEVCTEASCYDTVYISGQKAAGPLAIDATHLYWINSSWNDELDNPHPGSLHRAPLAGGPVELLAEAQDTPGNLAVDDTHVYWSVDDDSIWRVAKAGGSPQLVVAAGSPFIVQIAAANGRVYFLRYDQKMLYSVTTSGTEPDSLTLSDEAGYVPIVFTVNDANVYWAETGAEDTIRIRRRALDGMDTPSMLAGTSGAFNNRPNLVATPTDLYYSDVAGWIGRVPIAGGDQLNVFHGGFDSFLWYGVSEHGLYVLENPESSTITLWRAPLTPGTATEQFIRGFAGNDRPLDMVLGPDYAYWTMAESDTIYRFPLEGSTP